MDLMDFSNFTSFRELDALQQQTKGWAFKRFKQLADQLVEGEDFVWLDHQQHAELITTLRAEGRIYNSTVNLVMLSKSGVTKVLAA